MMCSTPALATATAALMLLAACSSNGMDSEKDIGTADSDPTTTSVSTTAAAATPLEGGWTANLKRSSVVAYIRNAGWSRQAQRVLLDPSMAGPRQTEFRIDFVGDQFRMSQVATDIQWQSGSYQLKDDGAIWLDDEAPVGYLTFQYHLDGDQVTFDHAVSQPAGMHEFMPGVPDWAPGAVLWASVPWHQEVSH